ncbi:DUF805 domain-containing protein [Mesorhizobium sp. ANAO-SY3R2]|uniref:DUF805 domain-containing protein n=1 Tax=Mesorhizobium sp. ANAO-SY3R2 TaxID=3166644 RepID=UPI00366E3753
MRGEVLHYDETQGFGFISGVDGNRYAFAREDLRRVVPMGKGTQVEFQPDAGYARGIFLVRPQHEGAGAEPAAAPQFGRQAGVSGPSVGLWSYFWRAISANYVNFRGRARRKEYWGFYLFWAIGFFALLGVGVGLDEASGNFVPGNSAPVFSIGLLGLFIAATVLPSIAVTVRRIHDLGLSGWFYLLILLPYFGGLIIFVFALIPSQAHENRWGPVPAGVKVPPPYVPSE